MVDFLFGIDSGDWVEIPELIRFRIVFLISCLVAEKIRGKFTTFELIFGYIASFY